jgi:mRNA interferase RelE/StbE
VTDDRFELVISHTARRQLTDKLPEPVARRGTYRIIYRIDEPSHTVAVLAVVHRADAYRHD